MSQPNKSDLIILKKLWTRSPLSAREVHDAIVPDMAWSFSTTRTTLTRMERKGLLATEQRHGVRVYAPMHSKVRTLSELMRNFFTEVLELDGPLPTAAFRDSGMLSDAEVEELAAMIAQKSTDPSSGGDHD